MKFFDRNKESKLTQIAKLSVPVVGDVDAIYSLKSDKFADRLFYGGCFFTFKYMMWSCAFKGLYDAFS